MPKIGINPGHEACVEEIRAAHKNMTQNNAGTPKSRGRTRTSRSHRTSFTITDDMFKRKESRSSSEQPADFTMKSGKRFSQVIPAHRDAVLMSTISKKVDTVKNNYEWLD